MAIDATTTDIFDAPLASTAGPVETEYSDGSTIAVNSVLSRKKTPNAHRGRIALVAGISALALLGIGAGALAVMSHHDTKAPAPAQAPLNVQSTTALPTSPASTGAAVAPPVTTAPPAATTTETSTAVTPAVRAAAPIARRARLSPPATAPLPGAGPSDAAPRSRAMPAPITTTPAPVPAQPETPAVNQLPPVVGPSTAPTPPPAQPVTPQSATPQPQPATPQPQSTPQPQTVSEELPAPTLAKLPLSAVMAQKT